MRKFRKASVWPTPFLKFNFLKFHNYFVSLSPLAFAPVPTAPEAPPPAT